MANNLILAISFGFKLKGNLTCKRHGAYYFHQDFGVALIQGAVLIWGAALI